MAAILHTVRTKLCHSLLIGCVLSIVSVNVADAIVARTSTFHHFKQPERVGVTNREASSLNNPGGLSESRSTAGNRAGVIAQSHSSSSHDGDSHAAEVGTEQDGVTSNFDAEPSIADLPRNINANKPTAIRDNYGEKLQTGSNVGGSSRWLTGSSDTRSPQILSNGNEKSNNDRGAVGSRFVTAAEAPLFSTTRTHFRHQLQQKPRNNEQDVDSNAATFSTNGVGSGAVASPSGFESDSSGSGRDVDQRTAQTGNSVFTGAVASNRAFGVLRSGQGPVSYVRPRFYTGSYSPYGFRQAFHRPNIVPGYGSPVAERFVSSASRYPYYFRPPAQYQQAAQYYSAPSSNLYGQYSPFSSFSAFGQQQHQPIRYSSSPVSTGSSYSSYSGSGTTESGSSTAVRPQSVSYSNVQHSASTGYSAEAAPETAAPAPSSEYDTAAYVCPSVPDDVCYGKDAGHYAHPDGSARRCFVQCDQYGEPFVRQCAGNTLWKSTGDEPALGNMCE